MKFDVIDTIYRWVVTAERDRAQIQLGRRLGREPCRWRWTAADDGSKEGREAEVEGDGAPNGRSARREGASIHRRAP